jgi:UDP-N-acetylmuramate dehydrogenase
MSVVMPTTVRSAELLSKYTTIGTGGPAQFFAKCTSSDELAAVLGWAEAVGHQVSMLGSGSNLLVADEGVEGVVIKLSGDLAKIEVDGNELLCGGGARLPAVAAAAAREGLTGLEFGVSIPGTVGGAVRMNANAYGGELARTLLWAEIVSAEKSEQRGPASFDFSYRRSNLTAGEVVAKARFRLSPADPQAVKESLAALRSRRKEAQPSGVRTFGSTFKNPEEAAAEGRSAGQLLDAAGCRDLRVGGAGFSEKHANFVVNHGGATTAEVVELMTTGRQRVFEAFAVLLEPEVQMLGGVVVPEDWGLWT